MPFKETAIGNKNDDAKGLAQGRAEGQVVAENQAKEQHEVPNPVQDGGAPFVEPPILEQHEVPNPVQDGGAPFVEPPILEQHEVPNPFQGANAPLVQPTKAANTPNVAGIITGNAPIVVFVGPGSSGKSMILMSIAEYLRKKKKYRVYPDLDYVNTVEYANDCKKFTDRLARNIMRKDNVLEKEALPGTISHLLVNIKDKANKKLICRLLEAPGEDFFLRSDSENREIKAYLKSIMTVYGGPVYYVMVLDLNTRVQGRTLAQDNVLGSYENRLIQFVEEGFRPTTHPERKDKIVLVYNKADIGPASYDIEKDPLDLFQNLTERLTEETILGPRKLYGYTPFITGTNYTEVNEELKLYATTPGTGQYAERLWKLLFPSLF